MLLRGLLVLLAPFASVVAIGPALAQDTPAINIGSACIGEGGFVLEVTSDTDLAPGRLTWRGAHYVPQPDVPVAGEGNAVEAGVVYPHSASRGGENFVLLDGEIVVAQHTDSDAPPCERGAAVERISGPDRFATAAEIAMRFYQEAAVVYLASGESFPDALAGGGIPDNEDGPVLLVTRDTLPEPTRAALSNLNVRHIRVLGGPAAISDTVVEQARVAAGL